MTGVQLEIGSTASAFQYEKPNENLLRCRRYYADRESSNAILYGSTNTGGVNYSNWQFQVQMRAAPTCTGVAGTQQQTNVDSAGVYNSSGTFAIWYDGATADAELS